MSNDCLFGFNTVIPMVKVISDHDLSWCVLQHRMEALSTGFSKVLLHSLTVECFLILFINSHFQEGLQADWVSGTNRHNGTPESTADTRSEAAAEIGEGAIQWRQRWKRDSCRGLVSDLIRKAGSCVRLDYYKWVALCRKFKVLPSLIQLMSCLHRLSPMSLQKIQSNITVF